MTAAALAILAALATSTKNEGWLCVIAVICVTPRSYRLYAAMLPILGITLAIRSLAPPDALTADRDFHSYWLMATAWDRYVVLGQYLWRALTTTFLCPAMALSGVWAFRPHWNRSMTMLAIIFSGQMAAIILSPFEIRWQCATALDRLLMQLLPAAVFAVLSGVRNLNEIKGASGVRGTLSRAVEQGHL